MFETLTQRLTQSFSFLRGKRELSEENVEEGLRQVRTALLEADVHFKVVRDFTARVKQRILGEQQIAGVDPAQQFVHAFHRELVELMGPEDARLAFAKSGPTVILMAGLQGAGKTTTCAKLAKLLRDKHQKRPLLVAADVKRPAAVEQLRVLGKQIDVPVFFQENTQPPALCAAGVAHARAKGFDVVLLDTAGRLHVDDAMMAEVVEIARVVKPHDQVLVVDAMTGQDAVNSAKAFDERLELTGVILTKLDGDARGGAAVSLKEVTGRPILYVGVGEKTGDLDAFHPERMAGRILGMGDVVGLVERAQEQISETEAQASFEKMVLGSFTLEDMLAQLRMIRKLGPMKKVLGMLPGIGSMADGLDVDDKQMNRLEALFTSMTPRERLQPDVLDMSRRRRVARGAGQDVGAINELLKRFKEMKRMMKEMNKLGLGAKLGSKAKQQALRGMSATGELAPGAKGGGGFGLGSLFGRGKGDPAAAEGGPGPGGLGDLGGLGGGDLSGMLSGPRPMGASATRKSAAKRKEKERKKRKKGKRR
jgi:signal recognition particle subunit SRP54